MTKPRIRWSRPLRCYICVGEHPAYAGERWGAWRVGYGNTPAGAYRFWARSPVR